MLQSTKSVYKSKKDLVYEHLRMQILHGEFQPGERIVIDGLVGQLGVSQIPIREALQQLQSEGFVVMEPHVGPRVAPIDPSLLSEVFQLLGALEAISSRAACQQMTEADLDSMKQKLENMESLGNNLEEWSRENARFHYSLCDWGGTSLIKSLMAKVLDQWDRLRHYYLKDALVKRIELSQKEHWKLYDALRARDADRAEQIALRHNQRVLADYIKYLKDSGKITEGESKEENL